MYTVRVSFIVLLLFGLLAGCTLRQPQHSTDKTQPAPPAELESLPRRARIVCAADPRANAAGVGIWELPGTKPSDPNSAYQGNRGKQLGIIQGCTEG